MGGGVVMDEIVRIEPHASYASLSAALTLAKGRRVALVFPVGERTCLHDAGALLAFRKRCHLLDKEAVIIGGDAWLRAHSIAAGFQTATTLEDWGETAPEMAAAPLHRGLAGMPRLQIVRPGMAYTYTNDGHDDDTWTSEPPAYVIEIRKTFPVPSPDVRTPVMPNTLSAAAPDEDDEGDDPIIASERFEEMMTGRILATSGIHRPNAPSML